MLGGASVGDGGEVYCWYEREHGVERNLFIDRDICHGGHGGLQIALTDNVEVTWACGSSCGVIAAKMAEESVPRGNARHGSCSHHSKGAGQGRGVQCALMCGLMTLGEGMAVHVMKGAEPVVVIVSALTALVRRLVWQWWAMWLSGAVWPLLMVRRGTGIEYGIRSGGCVCSTQGFNAI